MRNVQIYQHDAATLQYTAVHNFKVQPPHHGSAPHVVVELPLNLKIISGMIRLHSIDSIQAFPHQAVQAEEAENLENKH